MKPQAVQREGGRAEFLLEFPHSEQLRALPWCKEKPQQTPQNLSQGAGVWTEVFCAAKVVEIVDNTTMLCE